MASRYDVSGGDSLVSNTRYYVRVQAFDGTNYSRWSRTEIVLAQDMNPPDAPTNLQVDGVATNMHVVNFTPLLGWTFNQTGKTQSAFRVQIGVIDGVWEVWDSGKVVSSVPSVLYGDSTVEEVPDIPLVRGTIYCWRVRTWNNLDIAGPFSATEMFRLNRLPTAPDGVGVVE